MNKRPHLPYTKQPVFADMDQLDMCALKTVIRQEFAAGGLVEVRIGARWVKATIAPSPLLGLGQITPFNDAPRPRATAGAKHKFAPTEATI